MKFLEKLIYSAVLFLAVAVGTALQFLHFYNRTPWRIGTGIILGAILFIALAWTLIWKRK